MAEGEERQSRPGEPRAFLSTLPAEPGARRLAYGVIAISTAMFAAAAPFAKTQLVALPAFLPAYQAAFVLCDLMTAVLLFGQFSILRNRGLTVLGAAYLFSALMAVAHALSFPKLFLAPGVLNVGPQTTAWLYF